MREPMRHGDGARLLPGAALAFALLGLALSAYWTYPLLVAGGVAGPLDSLVGNLLLVATLATVGIALGRPLRLRLKGHLRSRRSRGAFAAASFAFALGGLFAGHALGPAGAAGGSTQILPILSPFGLWPSVEFSLPSLHLEGYLSLESVGLFALWGYLSAGLAALAWTTRRLEGPMQAPRSRAALPWLPLLALNGGCCSGPYLLGAIAPAAGAGAAAAMTALFGSALGTLLDGGLVFGAFLLVALALVGPRSGPAVGRAASVAAGGGAGHFGPTPSGAPPGAP